MTVQPTSNLLTRANAIRTSVAGGAVTPSQVGGLMADMVDTLAAGGNGIDPAIYGAIGDEVADDLSALLLAIAAGVAAGLPVVGMGRTYGISGNLVLVEDAWLRDISFKQLSPAGSTRRTLTSSGGNRIRLERVTVDRNGTGEFGLHQSSSGIYIDGGSNHYFEDVEVFGDDIGGGFFLINASDCDLVRVHTHDINYLLGADPGNDRVMGIYLNTCTRIRLIECQSHDLGGDFGGGHTLRYTRGFGFSGTTGVQMLGCRWWMVDQGSDMTGQFNTRFIFDACYASDCLTYGFKFANTAYEGLVGDCIAERCALSGFIASGPSGATSLDTRDITFSNCTAYDTGATGLPGTPVAGGKIAFRADEGISSSVLGIRWLHCKAIDTQSVRTMTTGFYTDVNPNINGKYNECVDCVVVGNLGAAFTGIHQSRCELSRNAVQSIAVSGTWTSVDWNSDVDLGAMHDTAVNNNRVLPRRDGNYRVTCGAVFAANATGQRGVRIVKDGTPIPGTTMLVDAAASGETAVRTEWCAAMTVGANFSIEVMQSSGGALNLQTTSGGIVEQVG